MSQNESSLSAAVMNELHFYLRTPGGSLYGPVAYNALTQWAEAGRVAAGDEVSHDRKLWMPATNLPGLKMEWMGRRTDGKDFGPFNLMAVPHLVQHGILDATCTLTHRTTGRTVMTASLVKPAADAPSKAAAAPAATSEEAVTPPPHSGAVARTPAEKKQKPAPSQADIDALLARIGELERMNAEHAAAAERLDMAEEVLADEKRRAAEQARAAADHERELTSRINKAQEDLHTANLLLEAARVELERQKQTARAVEAAPPPDRKAAKAMAALQGEIDELKRAGAASARNAEDARRSADDKAQRLMAEARTLRLTNEALESKSAEAQSRIAALQRDLAKAQESAESLRKANQGLEKTCAEAQSRIAPLERDLAAARSSADALRREREQSAAQATGASSQLAELAQELEAAGRLRSEAEQSLAAAKKQAAAAQQATNECRQEIHTLHSQLASARADLQRATADFAQELTRLRVAAAPAQWKVRLGKDLYGPVSTADLFAWAADCRIAPDTEVSRDGAQWIRAREVPDLHMEWNVLLLDGTTYGPVNLLAVSQLVQDGAVQPDAAVTHCSAGTKLRASELAHPLATELRSVILRLQTELAESRRTLRVESETRSAVERRLQSAAVAVAPTAAVPTPPPTVLGKLRARTGLMAGA